MAIHISPEIDAQDNLIAVNLRVDAREYKRFQEVWQRGTNLWPDAPDYIKKAADIITSGKIMQDYMNMSSEVKQ